MADLVKYTYKMDSPSPLRTFAFLGGIAFTKKLEYLRNLAEPENWYYDSPNAREESHKKTGVLFQYIHHTFARAQDEGKVIETSNCAIFNTGLFTPNGEEIYALFVPNERCDVSLNNTEKWFLKSFYQASSHELPSNIRSMLPDYVDYFRDNPHEMYFDPSLKIFINIDHIIEDHFDRLPDRIKTYPKDIIQAVMSSAETVMTRKISRNNRLVVPQYYNKKIMYLAPLQVGPDIIPLAIERHDDTYRVNTIFTRGMAYCNARLLMKPESNWLTNG